MFVFNPWRNDPGPCPVDDTPHTACCAPESAAVITTAAGPGLTIPVQRPHALERTLAAAAVAAAAAQEPPPVTFTTKTYRRALHGPNRKKR